MRSIKRKFSDHKFRTFADELRPNDFAVFNGLGIELPGFPGRETMAYRIPAYNCENILESYRPFDGWMMHTRNIIFNEIY